MKLLLFQIVVYKEGLGKGVGETRETSSRTEELIKNNRQ